MTEKRFTFHHDVDGIDYIQDETNGFCFICDKLLCSLLNDLSEENGQLKKDCTALIYHNQEYRKENEQLRLQLNNCSDQRNEFHRGARENANRVGKLEKENEQLKKILNELSDMLQFDVENGIRSYPVKLSEYLSNALKELQE